MSEQTIPTAAQKLHPLYANYETDPELETKGVIVEYDGDVWFRIARAGGANKAYEKRLQAVFKPHRRAVQTETMSTEMADKLMRQVFYETVILEAGCGKNQTGSGLIPDKNGNLIAVTRDSLDQLFAKLPDLYADLNEQSKKISLFRQELDDADVKN